MMHVLRYNQVWINKLMGDKSKAMKDKNKAEKKKADVRKGK